MSRTQLLDQLLLLSAVLQEDQERSLGALGLNQRRTHLMWVVHHDGPRMQRDLADAMQITPRHVTTLVDELIAAGLVERAVHPADRRAVLITLTARGASLMATMTREHQELAASLTAGWSDADVDELRESIEQIVGRVYALIAEATAIDGQAAS